MLKYFFYLLLIILNLPFLSAQNTWTGNANNDWHNACNWSRHRIPTCADSVLVPSGTPTINNIAGCYYLTVSPGAEVDLNSTAGGVLQVGTCPVALTYSASCVTSNTWCQKVDFGGLARNMASGFSIGTKGYITLGDDNARTTFYTDLWEWDQATNVWTQKANFPGAGREQPAAFSIGTKGYIAGGVNNTSDLNDFYEWNQATNIWTAKANMPSLRSRAVGFSIGTKGYVGTGFDKSIPALGDPVRDLLEYDPATNLWAYKAPIPGVKRLFATGFSIGTKGYVGMGYNDVAQTIPLTDFYEYDQATNTWAAKAAYPGVIRGFAVGFSMGTKGYVGTGTGTTGAAPWEFYEYNQGTNAWAAKTSIPAGRYWATGFSIGTNGYIGTGQGGGVVRDFWEYCQ